MSLKGLRLREQKQMREAKRRAHPGHHKPSKEQRADRQARVEYNRKKVIANERERAIEQLCEA